MNYNSINHLARLAANPPQFYLNARKMRLVGLLERLCQELELTIAQLELARRRYEGVGAWLAASDEPLLRALAIYLQGSTALGTTVRPLGRNEHDVDLIAHNRNGTPIAPAIVKAAVGRRLKENGHYAPLLEEKARCWRLTYANEFHLDITPSIPNPACGNGGELVPDKAAREWKASNPKGYRSLFERRAALVPQLRVTAVDRAMVSKSGEVEPFPDTEGFKCILQRIVQIAKRHRDVHFEHLPLGLAPISVILTTLLSQSYEFCVRQFVYDTEFDLLCDVLRRMPHFIEQQSDGRRTLWFVWNETTQGENFAEKWNDDARLPQAFFRWHAQAVTDLEVLADLQGMDVISKHLGGAFGSSLATKVMNTLTAGVSENRSSGMLKVAPGIGLTTAAVAATPVRANTFFGAP